MPLMLLTVASEYKISACVSNEKILALSASVFKIDNSKRIVDNIINDLTNTFEKRFSQSDSVYIFKMSSSCEVLRYGYAKNEENDFFIIT